ncbi:MAG: glycosyltransferase family 4 protein [Clostridiales bacterium]|nr:glycosyltransferase family 4 protein [Clostridiales bacterium]
MENNKINIGLFIDTFFPMVDGVINVVDNYAKRLNKIANVTVFAPKVHGDFDKSKLQYNLVQCKSAKLFFLDYDLPMPKFDRKFKKAVNESNLDIVHIHSPFGVGKMGYRYAKKHNIPVVCTFHSQFKKDFLKSSHSRLITKIMLDNVMSLYNKCDEGWAVNKEIGEVFKGYGYKKEPIVHNNGTDFFLVEDGAKADELVNKTYGLDKNEVVFLFVGRINLLKNILFIVDALKLVKEKGYKFKMLYVGSGQDEEILKEHIKKNDMGNEVMLCGRVTDRELMRSIYHRAKLFLFPSLYDASSLVQIEAASQKTPTIFLEGAVTAGTVTNEVNGFIVENSTEKFADKIIQVLNDEKYYNNIAENAYRDLFVSWDDVINNTLNDYKRLIDKKKSQK